MAMFMVMMALAVASVMAVTFLGGQTTSTALARSANQHAQARMIAEDVADLARRYVTDQDGWRDLVTHGNWTASAPWGGGSYRVRFEDPRDADLADDHAQPVRVLIEASYLQASHRLELTLTPTSPLGSLRVLFVAGQSPASAEDQRRADLLSSWGYRVTTVADSDGQAVFDAAAEDADVVYISASCSAGSLGTRLNGYALGVVNECRALRDELQMLSSGAAFDDSQIEITDASHPITRGLTAGTVAVTTNTQALVRNGGPASGLRVLGTRVGGAAAVTLGLLEVGETQLDGQPSPQRRVMLPWGGGGFEIASLTDQGRLILRQALEWAGADEGLGLAHHWSLDEAGGATAADTLGGQDAAYTQGPVPGRAGISGQAVELSSSPDRITLPPSVLQGRSSVTFSTWVRTTHTGSQSILSGNRADRDNAVLILLQTPTSLRLYREGYYASWSIPNLADGQWHLITVTVDAQASAYTVYIDGQSEGSVGAGVVPIDVEHLVLGEEQDTLDGSYQSDQAWVGAMDDVRIYGRALTAAEVAALYDSLAGPDVEPRLVTLYEFEEPVPEPPTLVGHWPLDDATALPAHHEADGRVAMEEYAASGYAGGSGAAASSYWNWLGDSSASGGLAIRAEPNNGVNTQLQTIGPRVDYHIEFTNPGTYRVWARMKGGGSDDSIHIGLDGTPLTNDAGTGFGRSSSSWTWVDEVGGGPQDLSVTIPAPGRYTLNMWMREDGVAVDKLVLDATATTPSGNGPAQGEFYAHCEDDTQNRHGAYHNYPWAGQPGHGDGGTSVSFDGSNDRVEIPHSPAHLLDKASVSFWFRADNLTGIQGLVAKDSAGYDQGGHLRIYLDGGMLKARLQSTTADYQIQAGGVAAGRWHHVIAGLGPGGFRLYLDGVRVAHDPYAGGLGATSGGSGNAEPWTFGVDQVDSGDGTSAGWNHPFDGRLDDVRLYDQNLDAQQVARLFAGSPPGPAEGNYVPDVAGTGRPLDLTIADLDRVQWVAGGLQIDAATRLSSEVAATKLYQALADAPGLTLEAEFTPANATQAGPAPLLSYGHGTADRNLQLDQSADRYGVRLRTLFQSTGEPAATSGSALAANTRQHVIATYDGDHLRVYRNGRLELEQESPGGLSNWDPAYLLVLANETGGARPWLGTLHRVAIWDAPVDQVQARNLFGRRDPGPPAHRVEGLEYRRQWVESP